MGIVAGVVGGLLTGGALAGLLMGAAVAGLQHGNILQGALAGAFLGGVGAGALGGMVAFAPNSVQRVIVQAGQAVLSVAAIVIGAVLIASGIGAPAGGWLIASGVFSIASGCLSLGSQAAGLAGDYRLSESLGYAAMGCGVASMVCGGVYSYEAGQMANGSTGEFEQANTVEAASAPIEKDPSDPVVTNSDVRSDMDTAWKESNPGGSGYPPNHSTTAMEQGGWIRRDSNGDLWVQRWPHGGPLDIDIPKTIPPDAIASFHTHSQLGWPETPSPLDSRMTTGNTHLPTYVVGAGNIYRVDPAAGTWRWVATRQ